MSKNKHMSSFLYGKNTDLLPLYGKYKRKDDVNGSLNIIRNHGKWSIHSINCNGEQVNNRKSLHPDKKVVNTVSTTHQLRKFG